MLLSLFLAAATFVPTEGGENRTFLAGAAKVNLSPPIGYPIAARGQFQATSELDPLFARVLTLRAGDSAFALVSVDLTLPFGPEQMHWLKSETKRQTGISNLLVTATHTHAAPMMRRAYPAGHLPQWEQKALQQIVQAIAGAQKRMVPVRTGVGWGLSFIGFNRLSRRADVAPVGIDRRNLKADSYPMDPSVGVLRLDKEDGTPLAIVVNYACHPVIVAPQNERYSADFPGAATSVVEREWPQAPVCLFLQGGLGNINPHRANLRPADQPAAEVQRVGESLGREVLRICRQVESRPVGRPGIKVRERELTFQNRWTPQGFEAARERYGAALLLDRPWQPPPGEPIRTSMMTALINEELALVALPGEPFVEFQLELRRRSPLASTFLVGLANDYIGYLPTIEWAAEGGFGADTLGTIVEVGAGERMITDALVDLYSLSGRLRTIPSLEGSKLR